MKNIYHRIVRFLHTKHISILGWPTPRMRAVWWLYEIRLTVERWQKLAHEIKLTNEAMDAWQEAVRRRADG